jgi:hypothetical protein
VKFSIFFEHFTLNFLDTISDTLRWIFSIYFEHFMLKFLGTLRWTYSIFFRALYAEFSRHYIGHTTVNFLYIFSIVSRLSIFLPAPSQQTTTFNSTTASYNQSLLYTALQHFQSWHPSCAVSQLTQTYAEKYALYNIVINHKIICVAIIYPVFTLHYILALVKYLSINAVFMFWCELCFVC